MDLGCRMSQGCKAGDHRSPICAAVAKEELTALGYSVAIMELSLVQPEMLPWMIAISEDWHANRMANVDFLSSYSNFSMVHCIRSEYHYKLSEISAAVQEMIEEEQEPSAKAARLVPKQPDVAPPMPKFIAPSATPSRSPETGRGSASSAVAPSSSRVATSLPRPPPVPQSDLSDDILQPEEWAIVQEHELDDQAVIALKRLGRKLPARILETTGFAAS